MRTAPSRTLRTSIVTAALAGALLVPATGSAFAAPVTAAAAPQAAPHCDSGLKQVDMGAGVRAELRVTANGPIASLISDPQGRAFATLYRTEPSLPDSAGITARIVNPSSSKPVFEWKTQGGGMPVGRISFPAFPEGCKPKYSFTDGTAAPKPKPKPTTTAKPQPSGQTKVVPKGPVAAGAELPVETAADSDNSTTLAAGAGLVAILAALGTVAVRRRRHQG
ncbi:hypothetical protein ACFRJ1_17345 [Streptomyces sp. NPDC056773]|uniref:hypothetical protein n=1 Tax=unclassified Streptomyces TaxID=2593676 RepID=UPI0036AD8958